MTPEKLAEVRDLVSSWYNKLTTNLHDLRAGVLPSMAVLKQDAGNLKTVPNQRFLHFVVRLQEGPGLVSDFPVCHRWHISNTQG